MNKVADRQYEAVARPRKATIGCVVAAVAVVLVCSFVATALRGETEGGGVFHAADQYAMVGLGLLCAAGLLAFARPRVWANASGVKVRNIVGVYELPWEIVAAVSFPRGASFAQLELADGDVVAMNAIQAVDGDHAVTAIRALRALHSGGKTDEAV